MFCLTGWAKLITTTIFFFSLLPTSIFGDPPPQIRADGLSLSVEIVDVKRPDGKLLISLFDRNEGFPKEKTKALRTAKRSADTPTHTFKGLPPGNYAVVVIHDRNNSGNVDTNFVGMPKEPIGVSNYKTISMRNRPNFRQAQFRLESSGVLKIKLIEL